MKNIKVLILSLLFISFSEQGFFSNLKDKIKNVFESVFKEKKDGKDDKMAKCDGYDVPEEFSKCVETLEYEGIWGKWGDVEYMNNNERGSAAQFRF